MKKILSIIALMLSCAIANVANAQSIEALDNIAEGFNKNCPRPAGDGLTLKHVETSDTAFIFMYDIADDMAKNIERLGGILHDSTLAEMMSSPNPDTQQLLTLCRDNKLKILIELVNSEGKAFEIIILPEEL